MPKWQNTKTCSKKLKYYVVIGDCSLTRRISTYLSQKGKRKAR